jgi:hypothetical protein
LDASNTASTTDLPEIEPRWKKVLPDTVDVHRVLIADGEGNPLLAALDPKGVRVFAIDDAGELTDSILIDPPPGHGDLRYTSIGRSETGPMARAALSLFWPERCETNLAARTCGVAEWVTFNGRVNDGFKRVQLNDEDLSARIVSDEHDHSFLLRRDNGGPYIEKRDAAGSVLWRQTAPAQVIDASFGLDGTALANDKFGAFTWNLTDSTGLNWFELNAEGAVEVFARISIDLHPSRHDEWSLRDTQGRQLLVGPSGVRDLMFLRVTPENLTATLFEVVREGYADLDATNLAMAPDGTVYVEERVGDREIGKRQPVMCRLPETGKLACFAVPKFDSFASFDQMVAQAGGVVFTLADTTLTRIDFPQ